MSATGRVALLLCLLPSPTRAQDAPPVHQAKPHFYNAVGGAVRVAWTAAPTALAADQEITLTMTIAGATNPDRVRRPDLAAMPEFKARFSSIMNGTDPGAAPGAPTVTFTYRLRPRDATVRNIPDLRFDYYVPGDDRLRTKYFDEIPLQVRPAAPIAAPALPLTEPDRFFTIPTEEHLRTGTTPPPDWRHWTGLIAFLAATLAVGTIVWRRRHPVGARLARIRRNRAARTALDGLTAASRDEDPTGAAAAAFTTYLGQRHGLVAPATGPQELAAALRAANLPDDQVTAVVELCRKFDAARFGGAGADAGPLIEQARELVLRWEGAA